MIDMATTHAMLAASSFRAIGTECQLLATEIGALPAAVALAREELAALDAAASRFRPDSEVCRWAALAADGPASVVVSELLADYLAAALDAAERTDGLVDPTVGSALVASGYDLDLDVVRGRTAYPSGELTAAVPGWRAVSLDPVSRRVWVPQGCLIDLGSTAKAHAADRIAARLAAQLPGGFLVNLGGDIAVAGPAPADGWQIGVEDAAGDVRQVVTSHDQAIATSSTRLRRWLVSADAQGAGQLERHHILDPRTGRTAPETWAQVSCAGASALQANAASTAAIVLGPQAPAWLEAHGIPARLDGLDGSLVLVAGWPAPTADDLVKHPSTADGGQSR